MQIEVAQGDELKVKQEDLRIHGHAIELVLLPKTLPTTSCLMWAN